MRAYINDWTGSSPVVLPGRQGLFPLRDYDLSATLASGQAFRWSQVNGFWQGVIGSNWVQLRVSDSTLAAETGAPVADWDWLIRYLQLESNLDDIIATFPKDAPMRKAVSACRGLRLLRQDPWETLASFILSSTKQIVQIQQIIALLCRRFGDPLAVPPGHEPVYSFPHPGRLASGTENDLRACQMGFRAPYLLAAARCIAEGKLDLAGLAEKPLESARHQLMQLAGVGRKIADCVLLFAYGFATAFPVDVWVGKALRELYFPRRRLSLKRLQDFSETHFGPHAGYAQQYLFHYIRVSQAKNRLPVPTPS